MNQNEKACSTILEMFSERGYTDIENGDEYIIAKKENGDGVYAFKNVIEKLNIEQIKIVIYKLGEIKISHGIVIHEEKPTSAVKNFLADSANTDIKIELFPVVDLQYNPTKHVLVPKHVPLSRREAMEFRQKYESKIPTLLKTDVISRFYGFERGMIIKIIRPDTISYRIVK
jgi:DNA-directed RNA polymerase I, II, and III subunit RPABC1